MSRRSKDRSDIVYVDQESNHSESKGSLEAMTLNVGSKVATDSTKIELPFYFDIIYYNRSVRELLKALEGRGPQS